MGMMVGWLRGPGSSGDDQASRGKGVAMVRRSMRLAMVVAGVGGREEVIVGVIDCFSFSKYI